MLKSKRRNKCISPKDLLRKELMDLVFQYYAEEILPDDIPTKWEKHGDLILLPAACFQNEIWSKLGDKLWNVVASTLKANRIAKKYRIKNDSFRTPSVELLKGSDGWVIHTDNKIRYTYDVTKCMFSCGNISEKLRIAKFSCEGETIVDLYAGIGYFTLPFLIHANASFVHACEWNPDAVEALEKNLILNNVKEKCLIHFGDNREICPQNVADRVNLGLIPSSEAGWKTGCQALKSSGGILHIHGNVTSYGQEKLDNEHNENKSWNSEWTKWAESVSLTIKDIFLQLYESEWNVNVMEVTHVKSYAPHIDHLVLDVLCRPLKT